MSEDAFSDGWEADDEDDCADDGSDYWLYDTEDEEPTELDDEIDGYWDEIDDLDDEYDDEDDRIEMKRKVRKPKKGYEGDYE